MAGLYACSAGEGAGNRPRADLRADSNRDGEVRFDDESDANKTEWNQTIGAILLANIDDDSRRCKSSQSDMTIALCNDAQDDVVNGEDDALDLARLKTRPGPQPEGTTGRVVVATTQAKSLVRIFKRTGPGAADFETLEETSVLSRAELEAGVELGVESRDIVRDVDGWDGYVDIELVLSTPGAGEARDKVHMRVAPVLTYHHLLPAERVWVSKNQTPGNRRMRRELATAAENAGVPLQTLGVEDQWTQDFFEPAYMSMPGPNGVQQTIRVNYRSPNIFDAAKAEAPLRPAGQIVFALRGKDVAGVQQFDLAHNSDMDSASSFGNFEARRKRKGVMGPRAQLTDHVLSKLQPQRNRRPVGRRWRSPSSPGRRRRGERRRQARRGVAGHFLRWCMSGTSTATCRSGEGASRFTRPRARGRWTSEVARHC